MSGELLEVTDRTLDVRFYEDADYEVINQWWNDNNSSDFFPRDYLDDVTGIIIELDGEPACACFMFAASKKVSWMEFVVCDPEIRREDREMVLDGMIKSGTNWAKLNGFGLVISTTEYDTQLKRLESNGYLPIGRPHTHTFRRL